MLKRLHLSQKSKRRCIFVLGMYMVLSGLFLLVIKQKRLGTYLTVSTLEVQKQSEILNSKGTLHSNITVVNLDVKDGIIANTGGQLEKASGDLNQDSDSSKPCFSPYTMPVSEDSMRTLKEKNMLKYFEMKSEYKISVPKWQYDLKNLNARKSGSMNGTKYFIASVLRVRLYEKDRARWTVRELKQWLHYQFWAGAEHAYICVHYLNESERFDRDLTTYINQGLITVIPWNHITSIPGSSSYQQDNPKNQVGCYNHVIEHYKNEAVWHYNFDMDENPYSPNDRCEGFLTRYLQQLGPNVSNLRLANFVLMGQGDRTRDIFYERINRITPKPFNGNVKPIYKVSMTKQAGMHDAQTTGQAINPSHTDLILLHYWGSRSQNWGPDTDEMRRKTTEFNDVRNTIAVNVRHSLIAFGDLDSFATDTGP